MGRVEFKIASAEKIAEYIYDLRHTLDESKLEQRSGLECIFVEFNLDLKKELFYSKKLTFDLKKKLVKNIKMQLGSQKKEMITFLKEIRKEWAKIEEIYFKEMKNIFEIKKYKKYICYLNNCVVSAYFKNNEISLTYSEKFKKNKEKLIEESTFIIGEEILHLIYFDYIGKLFNKNFSFDEIYDLGNDEYSGWHLVELMPEYLLVQNPLFKKFGWNKINREKKGYFWISKIRKKIDRFYDKKDFKKFIIKIHESFNLKK